MEMPKMRRIAKKTYAWAETLLGIRYILFYKRELNGTHITCSACGGSYKTDAPAYHNETGKCALCKETGTFKSAGRCKNPFRTERNWITGQAMGDDYVFRAFTTSAVTRKEECTKVEHFEYARIFLRKGKKPEKWYQFYSWGRLGWYPYNLGGMRNISIIRENYAPGYSKEIQKTWLKYGIPKNYDPIDYYSALSWHPALEMFQKSGMTDLEWQVIAGYAIN